MVDWALISQIEGWFNLGSLRVWDAFLSHQAAQSLTGNMLEIGVWKGRSAVVLASYMAPSERLFLVDLYLKKDDILKSLSSISCDLDQVALLQTRSKLIKSSQEFHSMEEKCRWIHIDGQHAGYSVWHDMAISDQCLAPKGLLVLDDFFSPAYPQITVAALDFLTRNPYALRLLLVGHNKAYFCRPDALGAYHGFILDELAERLEASGANVTICHTSTIGDSTVFGIVDRLDKSRKFRGPDWTQGKIECIATRDLV